MDYAKRLLEERDKYKDSLELIMRVYFELHYGRLERVD